MSIAVSVLSPIMPLFHSLGWLGTGQLVGFLVGPIISGRVADLFGSYRVPSFFAGAISLVAFFGTWRFVPERFSPPTTGRQCDSLLSRLSTLTRTQGLVPLTDA